MRGLFKIFLFCFVSVSYAKEVMHINLDEIQFGRDKTKPYEFRLKPRDPKSIHNDLLWKVKIDCEIVSDDPNSPLLIRVTEKKGTLKIISKKDGIVDDEVLVCGESRQINLKHDYEILVSADPGATVELFNNGEKDIITACGFGWN